MSTQGKPKGTAKKSGAQASKLIVSNKRAYHEYHVEEKFTAGIVLTGTEIKSIRNGKVSLANSFAKVEDGEVFLHAMHIAPYEQGTHYNHEPLRVRKLLLTRREIRKLVGKIKQSNYTLVPLKLFFSRCWVKVELGLCKGKKLYDKREVMAKRDQQREMDRARKSKFQ